MVAIETRLEGSHDTGNNWFVFWATPEGVPVIEVAEFDTSEQLRIYLGVVEGQARMRLPLLNWRASLPTDFRLVCHRLDTGALVAFWWCWRGPSGEYVRTPLVWVADPL